jgi:hypothetical protein
MDESGDLDKPSVTSIYPNPMRDEVYLQLAVPVKRPGDIRILDMLGRIQKVDVIMQSPTLVKLKVGALKAGMYLVRVPDSRNKTIIKVIKK